MACFQVVLDKGQEDDWFASSLIRIMFGIGVPVLIRFFLWEWYHDDPIVDVRLLKNRNFGTAVFFSFTLGMVLFGSTVLIPEFLQTSLGYTAERAGMALSPAGFVLMLMMPIAGRLTATQGRSAPAHLHRIPGHGLHAAPADHHQPADRLSAPSCSCAWRRSCFMPLIFMPISTLNYVGVPREKNNQVSGLSNFARNLGGSIGTSLLSTFLARQNQIHQVNFAAHTSHGDPNFERWIAGMKGVFMSQGYDAVTAGTQGAGAGVPDGAGAGEHFEL